MSIPDWSKPLCRFTMQQISQEIGCGDAVAMHNCGIPWCHKEARFVSIASIPTTINKTSSMETKSNYHQELIVHQASRCSINVKDVCGGWIQVGESHTQGGEGILLRLNKALNVRLSCHLLRSFAVYCKHVKYSLEHSKQHFLTDTWIAVRSH